MATIPSPPTFTVQQKLTAALMNTNVRDAINFLTAPPLCVLTHSATQTLTTATVTPIVFDTEATDTDGMHSTASNTSRITAVTAGYYLVAGHIPFAANATGGRHGWLSLNGTTTRIAWASATSVTAATITSLAMSGAVFLNVGDYVELMGYQTSGGNLATDITTGSARLTALWVHI